MHQKRFRFVDWLRHGVAASLIILAVSASAFASPPAIVPEIGFDQLASGMALFTGAMFVVLRKTKGR